MLYAKLKVKCPTFMQVLLIKKGYFWSKLYWWLHFKSEMLATHTLTAGTVLGHSVLTPERWIKASLMGIINYISCSNLTETWTICGSPWGDVHIYTQQLEFIHYLNILTHCQECQLLFCVLHIQKISNCLGSVNLVSLKFNSVYSGEFSLLMNL